MCFSHIWLWDPIDYSPPGSSVHGIFHVHGMEWVAMPSSRGSSQPREQTHIFCVSCIGGWILYHWATWEAHVLEHTLGASKISKSQQRHLHLWLSMVSEEDISRMFQHRVHGDPMQPSLHGSTPENSISACPGFKRGILRPLLSESLLECSERSGLFQDTALFSHDFTHNFWYSLSGFKIARPGSHATSVRLYFKMV